MGKVEIFKRPSIRFSYAYPHQKLRPKSKFRPSAAQSSIKTPLKTQNSGVSIEFSEHPKDSVKNFTLSDHENAFVEHESVYLVICIFVSELHIFPDPFSLFFNLFCRQDDTCTQGITPMWNRIYLPYCVRNSNRISGYFACLRTEVFVRAL